MHASPLAPLLLEKRVVVVAGAGGVGKTTVSAALARSAASRGRRVLCLTIDPAKRLFDRLGLNAESEAEQVLDPAPFAREGLELPGELTIMMLDTKRTFDDLVRRHAADAAGAERILHNEFYEYVSTQLAGTQAYMAMEKVLAVLDDDHFDLVVLDTPPTSDALDFLDAPERLVEVVDSAALRWLAEAFDKGGRLSLNLVARGVAMLLKGMARLTGRGFLERLAEFVSELNQLFGGFKERAQRVAAAFRDPDFAYLLVAPGSRPTLNDAAYFAERLERLGMRADGLIVNRVLPRGGSEPELTEVQAALGSSADLAERVLAAYRAEIALAELEQRTTTQFSSGGGPLGRDRLSIHVEVPAFPESVHDVAALTAVARRFV